MSEIVLYHDWTKHSQKSLVNLTVKIKFNNTNLSEKIFHNLSLTMAVGDMARVFLWCFFLGLVDGAWADFCAD